MARRMVDNSEDAYAAAYFNRGQQEFDPHMRLALELLGMQQKQQGLQTDRELEAQKQAALERYQQGQLGVEQERLGVAKSDAERAEAARQSEATRRIQEDMNKAQQYSETKAFETQKAETEAENKKNEIKANILRTQIAAGRELTPMEQAQLGAIDPSYKEMAADMREKALSSLVATNLERFKSMTPEQRKAITQNPVEMQKLGGVEGYQRIMKQLGDSGVPEAPARPQTFANTIAPAVDARDYSQFPGSVEDLIAASNGKLPPSSAPPTTQQVAKQQQPQAIQVPTTVGYGRGDQTDPEWRYGTGTLSVPQVQTPQVSRGDLPFSVDDLLSRIEAERQQGPVPYTGKAYSGRPLLPPSQPAPTPIPGMSPEMMRLLTQ